MIEYFYIVKRMDLEKMRTALYDTTTLPLCLINKITEFIACPNCHTISDPEDGCYCWFLDKPGDIYVSPESIIIVYSVGIEIFSMSA